MLLPPITPLGKHQAGQHLMSNRSAFYVEYVSIPLCRSAFGYRSYLKCFNVTTANYPLRKTSSRSAFNVEQVSILCRIREHSIVQVSIRIPIISLCRSAFDHTSSVSMLLPPITLLGKHQAGQHLTSKRSAFHIPLRQRFAVQMQRSIRSLSISLSSLPFSLIDNYIHAYLCLTVGRQSRDHRPLSRDPSVLFTKSFLNFLLLETSKKRCLTVTRRSRDLRPLSRDRSATFFKKFANCLKRPKSVVWQSADGRVTSTIVAWPFSDFFQNFPKSLETSKKRCLTVGRRSRDLRPLSRDRSATFFKNFSNCLKRPKNVVWQSADGRVTSDHCHVTVQRLFSKKILIAWNVQKTLFDSRPTVAWPQPLSRDRSATFFKIFPNRLKRPKNVVWQSADGRVTSDHCRVTVQRLFSKCFLIAWNVQKTLFDSRPTVAWPPTTVTWPFSDFFQKKF